MKYEFPVTKTTTPKQKPDPNDLPFGKYFTDHMFVMEYDAGQGWHDGRMSLRDFWNLVISAAVIVPTA